MTKPWVERRVLAYAHQGGELEAPSSTVWAIDRAIELGATGIELDVHATRDGALVVGHDPTVDRTTAAKGRIAELTLAELRTLDNAYWFVPGEGTPHDRSDGAYELRGRAPADRRLGIATLDEVLDEIPGVILNLDIKQTAPAVAPYEAALAATLAAHGRDGDDVIVASFFDSATAAFSAVAPAIGTAPGQDEIFSFVQSIVREEDPDPSIGRHAAIQIPPRFSGIELVTEALVDIAHDLGLAVHVWTIDDPAEMKRLCALGVDAIMSDRPSVLVPTLQRLGVAWRP